MTPNTAFEVLTIEAREIVRLQMVVQALKAHIEDYEEADEPALALVSEIERRIDQMLEAQP